MSTKSKPGDGVRAQGVRGGGVYGAGAAGDQQRPLQRTGIRTLLKLVRTLRFAAAPR